MNKPAGRPLLDRIREVGEEVKLWPVWMRRLMGIDTRSGNERRVEFVCCHTDWYPNFIKRKGERRGK